MYDMKHTALSVIFLLAATALPAFTDSLPATDCPEKGTGQDALVRVVLHPDGARSVFRRERNKPGMRCVTYADNKLVALYDYLEGKDGHLIGCTVIGPDRKPLYKVTYRADDQGRICEEKVCDPASNRLIQRVVFTWGKQGKLAQTAYFDAEARPIEPAKALRPTFHEALRELQAKESAR